MKKIVIVIAALVAGLVVIGFLFLYNIGTVIERAVNHYGPQYTKTAVTVGDVDVALFAGSAELKDFLVANPEKFKGREAFTVGSVLVDVNEKTVTGNPVVIESIRVIDPLIHYEVRGLKDNLRTILENIRQAAGAEKAPSGPDGEPKEKRKIIIEDFVLSGGEIVLAATGLKDREIRAKIPEIHLENIGGSGGTVPAEAFAIILDQINKVIRSAQVRDLLNQELGKLGISLEEIRANPGKPAEILRKEAGDAVRGKVKELLENNRESPAE